MRIECPSCGAEYEVPDRLLAGPARTLRCSRCKADFPLPRIEAAPPPPAPPPLPPEPEPAPEPPPPEPAPPAPAPAMPDERRLKQAWAASIAVVVVAVAAFVLARESVMAAWPASARLFAALGLG